MLELSAAAGEIDLKYVDESGFCAWSETLLQLLLSLSTKTFRVLASVGDEG